MRAAVIWHSSCVMYENISTYYYANLSHIDDELIKMQICQFEFINDVALRWKLQQSGSLQWIFIQCNV